MKLGYAMYSAREITTDPVSMRNVLCAIAQMGYEGVEFFLYNGVGAEELREMLEEFGLEAIGTHVHKPRWDADAEGEIDYAVRAQIPCLIYPWIEPELRNAAFYGTLPEELKRLEGLCREQGVKFQYHNHDFEFAPMEGDSVMDYLLKREATMDLELDTFWAQYAGIDVIPYMEKWGARIPMIHMKDYLSLEGADGVPSFCAIGAGKLEDNARFAGAAREMGKEWLIMELDNSPLDPLESARISIDTVRKMLDPHM